MVSGDVGVESCGIRKEDPWCEDCCVIGKSGVEQKGRQGVYVVSASMCVMHHASSEVVWSLKAVGCEKISVKISGLGRSGVAQEGHQGEVKLGVCNVMSAVIVWALKAVECSGESSGGVNAKVCEYTCSERWHVN